ncbi:acyl carrier protein [Streptomyces sp. M19]
MHVPATVIYNYPTPAALADRVRDLLFPSRSGPVGRPVRSSPTCPARARTPAAPTSPTASTTSTRSTASTSRHSCGGRSPSERPRTRTRYPEMVER